MEMTFTSFLLQLAFNLLASAIPTAAVIYLAVRFAIKHGLRDASRIAGKQPIAVDSTRRAFNE